MISDCLILWMNLIAYERLLQNDVHWALSSRDSTITGSSLDVPEVPQLKEKKMKWIHNGEVVDLTDNEVAMIAEFAVLADSGHTATVEGDGFFLARPVINPRLL